MGLQDRAPRGRSRSVAQPDDELIACEIRVLSAFDELLESYRLRYDVYGALGYTGTNDAKLEIDEYDRYSIPFGAFDPVDGTMIGTLRLVTTAAQPDYKRLISRILVTVDDDALSGRVVAERPHPLPSLISNEAMRHVDAFNSGSFLVEELSRTIVRPDHRGTGVSRGLMEFGLAHASQLAPRVLIGGCLPQHVPMYGKYGYVLLPDSAGGFYDSVGRLAKAVICRTDRLPEPTRAHVDELRRARQVGETECRMEIGSGTFAIHRFRTPSRRRRNTIQF
jgi:predicted GNAT family N-acyltransferase